MVMNCLRFPGKAALVALTSGCSGFYLSCCDNNEKNKDIDKMKSKEKPLLPPPGNKVRYFDENSHKYWWYEKESGKSYWENVNFNPPTLAMDSWDDDWDYLQRHANKNKAVHQIVLIRHGQYDGSSKDDERRVLTDLGVKQAEACGK